MRTVAPRTDVRMTVADHRRELLELDDDLVSRELRKTGLDRMKRTVELRPRHRMEEIMVPPRHLRAKESEILLPETNLCRVERCG